MSPLQFIRQRPFAVLGIGLVLWLLVPAALKRLAQVSLFEFGAPADFAASYARDLQQYWSLRTRSTNELIETARDLANLNASYEVRMEKAEAAREIAKEQCESLPSDRQDACKDAADADYDKAKTAQARQEGGVRCA